ncbi:MAG: hypothetical protein QG656_200, partial [Candidatus Hydrogenedentes bacterium]|nr:hypothetical protein [Candidatus Hydrogenedentota bacterium]
MKGESSAGRTRGRRWLYLIPVLVLVLLFTGNSWDWRAAESLGESLARSESRNTAEQIALRVEGMLHERENDLALLAELWHTYPEASRGERFEADASRLVQDEPSYYSINFVDADSIIRHSVSPTIRAELIGLDLKTRPGRKEMHEQVRQSMKPAISPPMELVSGRPGVVIWFPVRAGGLDTPAEGCIAGAFHIEEILRRAVADYSRKTFCIRVCLDGVEAWKAEWPSEGKGHPLESMGASGAVIFLGRTWSIDVHPRQDSVYAELPRGNLIRLGMNLLLSLVIAALLFIALYEVGRVRTSRAQLIEARRDRERLFNLSVDMFCVAGFDGFFKELNPAWTKRLGWSEEELRSTSALEFVHPDDRAATKEQIDRLRAGEAVQMFESRLRTASGGFCSTEWTAIPLIEEELIFGVVRDTTAQREIQAALRESEERFRATFEQAAVGIAHVSADGRFMRVNERFC